MCMLNLVRGYSFGPLIEIEPDGVSIAEVLDVWVVYEPRSK